jgi:hypothetical protein
MKRVGDLLPSNLERPSNDDPQVEAILAYLECQLPGFPFDSTIDAPFVHELVTDFPYVDILEQLKAFRWYHDNQPLTHAKKPRLKIRRWIAGAIRPREPW